MKKELIQDFSLRISQASKTELIVIMYDIILEDIKAAKEALLEKNSEGYTHELKHAGRIVNELMSALDYTYPVSYQLMSLYIFLNKQLIDAGREQDGKLSFRHCISTQGLLFFLLHFYVKICEVFNLEIIIDSQEVARIAQRSF